MAITVTAATFKARLPEFDHVLNAVVETWITAAKLRVNATQWAGKADEAVIFLTAHLLSSFVTDGSGPPTEAPTEVAPGPVSAEREGQVSVSYAIADHIKDSGTFATTKYGRYFVTLRREIFVTRKI